MYVPFIAFKPHWVSRHKIGSGWQCSGRVLGASCISLFAPTRPSPYTSPQTYLYNISLSLKFSLSVSDLWHTITHTHKTDDQRSTGRYMIMPWRWSFWKRLFWAAFCDRDTKTKRQNVALSVLSTSLTNAATHEQNCGLSHGNCLEYVCM